MHVWNCIKTLQLAAFAGGVVFYGVGEFLEF